MESELSTTIEPALLENPPQLATQWARIRGRLQHEVGDIEYRNWLRQMTLAGIDGDARHAREAISIKSEAETSDAIQPGAGGRLIVLL